jgi:hypothetical protein
MGDEPMIFDAPAAIQLPPLIGAEVPTLAMPSEQLRIASGFFGCWEGRPGKFTEIVGAKGAESPSALVHVVKCYLPGEIQTQEFQLQFVGHHPILDRVLGMLGLGRRSARVGEAKTTVYAVNTTQVYSRGTLKVELTEASLFKWPRTTIREVVDEEVATLVNADSLSISGRAFVTTADGPNVGVWSTDLHH